MKELTPARERRGGRKKTALSNHSPSFAPTSMTPGARVHYRLPSSTKWMLNILYERFSIPSSHCKSNDSSVMSQRTFFSNSFLPPASSAPQPGGSISFAIARGGVCH